MTYELAIHPEAEREWGHLDGSIKKRFKDKLAKERLMIPRVSKDAIRDLPNCYKIKITTPQFRLITYVDDVATLVTILSVASRDDVYEELKRRL